MASWLLRFEITLVFVALMVSPRVVGAQPPALQSWTRSTPGTPTPPFTGLGHLSGKLSSKATAVSADGSVVVGFSSSPDEEAFRWENGVLLGLGDLPGGAFSSAAFGVSADGAVIVGRGTPAIAPFGGPHQAFRWENDVMTNLGGLPGLPGQPPLSSEAFGVSADGSVVIGGGQAPRGGSEAFRWTSATGVVGLGDIFTAFGTNSTARAVSADGSVVTGQGTSTSGIEAFRWTQTGGMSGLSSLPSPFFTTAYGISRDGAVIVGAMRPNSIDAAFRWTEASGLVPIAGPLVLQSQANAASADGSVVVGYQYSGLDNAAFIWDATHGMRNLKDVLTDDYDMDLTGWKLSEAKAITPDGLVIVGYGTNPDGQTEAWRASLAGVTFTVTNTDDSGAGSLRQAILDANDHPGLDSIHFAIPGTGRHTLSPLSALPAISEPAVIDGYTQPGSSPNTHPFGQGTNAVLNVELNGAPGLSGPFTDGFVLTGGGTTLRGLVINRIGRIPIYLIGSDNVIEGNFIGTNATGTAGASNGLGLQVDSPGNRIGGDEPGARNVIAFNNGHGVRVSSAAHGNHIVGNFIGTNAAGSAALGNQFSGIELDSSNNEVRRNLISGNGRFAGAGVELFGAGNVVQENFIGTDVTAMRAIGNNRAGITVGASGNRIGGAGLGNVIAFNRDVFAQSGAGIEITTDSASANWIAANSIHSNTGLGLDLRPAGVNPNDPGDADAGANGGQNYPVLLAVETSGGVVTVSGQLASRPNSTYAIEFFSSSATDPSGYGEGDVYLGLVPVTTDASGKATIKATLAIPGLARLRSLGRWISATATDEAGNTSEFSRGIAW